MTREELEHLIRAAGDITQEREILVIGSQAVLATIRRPHAQVLVRSAEGDLAFRDEALADKVDGSIGESSRFHEEFGYYAQGITLSAAVLPPGWEARLVPINNENTRGVTGLCLEIHDLAISKLAAAREKDIEFVEALVEHRYVSRDELMARAASLPLSEPRRARVMALVNRLVSS